MKFLSAVLFFIFLGSCAFSQVTISGKVTGAKGEALAYASVGIKDSYDGTSTDEKGNFSFSTSAKGEVIISVKFLGYEDIEQKQVIGNQNISITFKMVEKATEMNTVVITAGSFEASDKKKAVVLRPIDIVTTAGANGDIDGAIKTLPGAQNVGESEGLFVRGGSAGETKTIIDEMVVSSPYFSSVPDVPQRGRFSPFLFKGTLFSTGGYSAQYGQALSSTLVLNTEDLADQTSSSLFLSVVGGGCGHTHRFKNSALSVDVNYSNLAGFFLINKQARDWEKAPNGVSGSIIYRWKPTESSIFKVYSTFAYNGLSLRFPNIYDAANGEKGYFWQKTYNGYLNTSYKGLLANNWELFAGASYSLNHDTIHLNIPLPYNQLKIFSNDISRNEGFGQGKVMLTKYFGSNTNLRFGSEVWNSVNTNFTRNPFDTANQKLHEVYAAAFVESDIFITRKLALRIGERTEYSYLLNKYNFAPRVSIAYKTGNFTQFSFAYGHFYQTPQKDILLRAEYGYTKAAKLNFEKATHYIANFQFLNEERTFRVEAYYKQYNDFVVFPRINTGTKDSVKMNNSGSGYARGIDVFWRDKKTIKNADYWISYSFLDTKRQYRDYSSLLQPGFATPHTFSVVYKHFITPIKTSLSLTYNYATGRPSYYFNMPPQYNGKDSILTTPAFNNLSIAASYLTSIAGNFTVIFASINNVFGFENIYGYRFSYDGTKATPITPTSPRSFFIGMFMAIGRK